MWDLSSSTTDGTHAPRPALKAQSPNHWTARDVPEFSLELEVSLGSLPGLCLRLEVTIICHLQMTVRN